MDPAMGTQWVGYQPRTRGSQSRFVGAAERRVRLVPREGCAGDLLAYPERIEF